MARVIGKSKYFSNDELLNIDMEGKSSFDYLYITPDRLDKIIDSAQPSAIEVGFLKSSNKMLKEAMANKERRIIILSEESRRLKSIIDDHRIESDGYNKAEGFSLSQCMSDILKRYDKIIMDKSRNEVDLENVLRDYERKELLTDDFINDVSRLAEKYPEFEKGYHTILCSYERSLYDKQ